MNPARFVKRVTIETASLLGALALGGAWLVDPTAGVGVLAGGALGLGNLWWLVRRVLGASETRGWVLGAAARLGVLGAAVAVVLASGVAHPVGVVVGLSVLPFVLIARGLAEAREMSTPP